MRILITNDDGIDAKGLEILIEKAKKYGDIIVLAPFVEQSAKSHSITIKKGLRLQKVTKYNQVEAYSLDSTPADCVRFAVCGLKLDFDVVFSGINRGYNMGEDILYSGTVGAASEAVIQGKKTIAFSSCWRNYDGIIMKFDEIMDFILNNKLLEECTLINVNVPENPKGIRITKQGSTHFETIFELLDDGTYYPKGSPDFLREKDKKDTDICAVLEECVSISPLTIDRTDYSVFNKLKDKQLNKVL